MVKVLLGDIGGACQNCRNGGLAQAAILGYEAKVQILLEKGADPRVNNAAAIVGASRAGKERVAMEMVAVGGTKIESGMLDMILGEAYKRAQYQLVTKCLREGARGVKTDTVLTMAVEKHQLELVDELIRHGASVRDGGTALGFAVQSGRCDLVQMVLQCRPRESILADAIMRTVKLADLKIAYQMIKLLLSAGLRGNPVSEVLIKIVDKATIPGDDDLRLEVLHLLLTTGAANINLREGCCIRATISGGCAEMLPVLLQYRPSLKSLSAGLEVAMDLPTLCQRQNVVGVLLKAGPVGAGDEDPPLLCAAMSAAAKRLLFHDVRALTELAPSTNTCLTGFIVAISTGHQWYTPGGLAVVKLLLDCGASGVDIDDAFCRAATLFHRDAVELLAYSASPGTLDKALKGIMVYSPDWQSSKSFWLLQLILELALDLKSHIGSANWALLNAVHAYIEGSASEDLVDLLLTVGAHADVNFRKGEALKMAVRAFHTPLLEKLLSSGATTETKTEVFHTILTEPLKEDVVAALLDVLFKHDDPKSKCDVRATLQGGFPPIAACLSAHPQSTKLLKRLLDLGCQLEAEFQWVLYTEKEIGQEAVTVLLWAIGHVKIASGLIEALIDAKADVNVIAPVSKSTPLIMAVRCARKDIVRKLISVKVNVTVRDHFKRSALFYASRVGDLESTKELVVAKSIKHDGSLHEAARNLHSEVVAVLIRGKHEANFPSSRHQGRTALQELVYKCDGAANPNRLEETILALVEGNADVLAKNNLTGQNALFLAIENPHPYAVTQALLDAIMWRDIKNENNIFTIQDPKMGTWYSYSPTMYIIKGWYKGGSAEGEKLLRLLREKGCPDRYFVWSGPQPADAVGMPDEIRKAEERRRRRKIELEESQMLQ